MVTLFAADGASTVACPGASSVALPSSGPCALDAAALGGLMPASSCINRTTGTCEF
jgi:hypothetical protein